MMLFLLFLFFSTPFNMADGRLPQMKKVAQYCKEVFGSLLQEYASPFLPSPFPLPPPLPLPSLLPLPTPLLPSPSLPLPSCLKP